MMDILDGQTEESSFEVHDELYSSGASDENPAVRIPSRQSVYDVAAGVSGSSALKPTAFQPLPGSSLVSSADVAPATATKETSKSKTFVPESQSSTGTKKKVPRQEPKLPI